MSVKFYTDTHIPKQVAVQLRKQGIDVVRCEDVGMAEADDEELLEYAVEHESAVITKDDDFLRLHTEWLRQGQTHFGIFYCPLRDRPAIGIIVITCSEYHDLIAGAAGTIDDDIKNQVIYIR